VDLDNIPNRMCIGQMTWNNSTFHALQTFCLSTKVTDLTQLSRYMCYLDLFNRIRCY